MVERRKTIPLVILCALMGSILPGKGVAASAQTSPTRQPAAATAAVDAAVRTGRVDAGIATQVASARYGSTIRALVVHSAPPPDGLSIAGVKETLAVDKAELESIPGIRVESLLPSLNTTVVEVGSTDALARLAALPDVTVVADELMQRVFIDSEGVVGAPIVRAHGYDGADTFIGIIDGGVDYRHYDLGSCTAPNDPAPCRVAIQPVDFSHNADGSLYDDGVLDDDGHGTNVASIASAMAPGARIVSTDVFGPVGAYSSDVANAIQYMINLKAAGIPIVAVNLSLGSNRPTCLDLVGVGALRSAGIIPVVAAGNSAYVNGVFVAGISSPACVPGVVSVGATHHVSFPFFDAGICRASYPAVDQVGCFSQASSGLSMLAPGVFITAGGVQMTGTSQAAPHVAGAIATLSAAVPQASPADLVAGVTSSSVRVFDPRIGLSFPRLSMPDALAATQARVPGASGPDSFDHPVMMNGLSGNVSTAAGFMAQNGEGNHGLRRGVSSTWFAWTAPTTGRLTLSTAGSSFDTAMSLYQGTALNTLTEVGANDDSVISGLAAVLGPLEVQAGASYRIAISCGVASSSCGSINLAWNLTADTAVPINDAHNRATLLSGASGAIVSVNTFATTQPGEPEIASGVAAAKSVWYKLAPAGANTIEFSTAGSNFDTTLSVFEGADPLSIRPLVMHDDAGRNDSKYDVTSRATVTSSRAGSTFWISVDSFSSQTGTVNLSWTSTPLRATPTSPSVVVQPRTQAPSVATPVGTVVGRKAAPASGAPSVAIEPPCADRFPVGEMSAILLDGAPHDPISRGRCWVLAAPTTTIRQSSSYVFSIVAPDTSWLMSIPLSGNGPTVGSFTNLTADQFRFESINTCLSSGSGPPVSDVVVTRADRNSLGQVVALDLSFEQRCGVGGPPLRGRIHYRPFASVLTAPCVAPTTTPIAVYDQRTAANPTVSVACMIYTPAAGPFAAYGPASRIALNSETDNSFFYSGLVGIKAKGSARLAVGPFPITSDATAHGVTVYGPCFAATSGTATVTSIQRNASDAIQSLDFTFDCTTPDGYFKGVVRLPYL
jgi:Subtilase family